MCEKLYENGFVPESWHGARVFILRLFCLTYRQYQHTLGSKVKFNRGSDILSLCSLSCAILFLPRMCVCTPLCALEKRDNVSSSTSASENLMWLYPVPVTDTVKAIAEITKPHSHTKSGTRTGKSLFAVFPTSAVFIPLWVCLWC